ncbi:MAG: nicotinate-nucleotide--dimethylbenzimidazole phosphoribosyltransferase, partial [Lachnospiraceae bacterium]|nr:nicotinate-nucleotide--dimethylbenzimidazole phosphoribosyltransferase [Lachnospiraceae bacterium]
IAGVRKAVHFSLDKKALIVMCGDNGIVEEGVTQTGQEVTAIVAKNFQDGRTCTNQMASLAGVDIFPIDIGIARDVEGLTVSAWKVTNGTKNFAKEPAMT